MTMTQDEEKAIADRVRAAFREVNSAIRDAATAGMEIQVRETLRNEVSLPAPIPFFEPSIKRLI
jgi:hypothetical protein